MYQACHFVRRDRCACYRARPDLISCRYLHSEDVEYHAYLAPVQYSSPEVPPIVSPIASPFKGGSFCLSLLFSMVRTGSVAIPLPAPFFSRKVCLASGLRHPFGPTPWMIAKSISPFSARTGFGGALRAIFGFGMVTFLGSSRIQFAISLLISPSESSFGFTTTARSSEPSPLKSPITNVRLGDAAGRAAWSN